MDLQKLLSNILSNLPAETYWLLAFAILLKIYQLPRVKGWIGEKIISTGLRLLLDKDKYHKFDNVTLQTQDGTTQIDHIVVSIFGIFVIETKNKSGWIFGSERQKNWTQTFGRSKFKFQNPLLQNYKHIKALEASTGLTSENFISIIAFVGSAKLKTDMPKSITTGIGCISYIKSHKAQLLTTEVLNAAISNISNSRLKEGYRTNQLHIANVKTNQEQPNCPKCGSAMVTRNSKQGKSFWGCSQFPKCRITRIIE